ncbi:MAG TPA: DUF6338 family protein [Actinophytocola sp.]|uniref:DUF6338 family protein n=1 Tax=Actinophytocola sp. TaxID=1872138 RepID=UPI002DDCE65F|nr:DUF6338 family protein [Actinophytocola sp.]HEV2780200.1 DUF6338 family protein [Actinophytocola sp.]
MGGGVRADKLLPTTVQQILLVVLFVMPGVVFQVVRGRLRGPGPDDRDVTFRVLRAIAVSAALDLIYLVIFTDLIVRSATRLETVQSSARQLALLALGCTIVIPVLLAALAHFMSLWRRRGIKDALADFWQYDPAPTAWDWFGKVRSSGYVRVLTKENKWIGGWAGAHSYISSYPESRDLYIDCVYEFDNEGNFTEPTFNGRASMWIRCDDVQLVEYIADRQTPQPSQPSKQSQLEPVHDERR